ncbi:fructosamine kinase family protein [Guptibacillus algicola]|uniref:fructosamine kinase family protein n=1 Tax=Guptibacillus algicola TaxID=225844 RepID=UPI001CD44C87|nr:fructosamine kinase family protein [Alkalihalobacillus algicola]MCA0989346.1 fructosamine kinase family protein [Alkalihalobacillus algicola]
MIQPVQAALKAYGDEGEIKRWDSVSGGSINDTYYVRTKNREYFAKFNPTAESDFFQAEVDGLTILEQNGVPVPKPLFNYKGGVGKNVLLLDWLAPTTSVKSDNKLGSVVANMHACHSEKAGLSHSNFIGELRQCNDQKDDWVEFYRDLRLGYLQSVAKEKGLLTKERQSRLTRLRENLHTLINHNPQKSLLHGDLWGGNWLNGKGGKPYLIDPAVYYGDREVDIAFTYLFGGYSEAFYQQYEEEYPLDKGFEDRFPIYQLYYLLVHLVIFGESYGSAVDRILKRYTTIHV